MSDVEVEDVPKKVSKSESGKETNSFTLRKITDLTNEEKKKIIADIKTGKEDEHYELKEFKNGTSRIVN